MDRHTSTGEDNSSPIDGNSRKVKPVQMLIGFRLGLATFIGDIVTLLGVAK